MNKNTELTFYDALSHSPNFTEGHEYDPGIYRYGGEPKEGVFRFKDRFHGLLKGNDGKYFKTNIFEIPYTQWGDKGPLVVLLHGVPTNRYQYYPLQKRLSPFCRTISIDLLGMGQSSFPRNYGEGEDSGINDPWDWTFDADRIELLMRNLYPEERFFFVADDWSGGVNVTFAAKYPQKLLGLICIDPIAFDGYPVNEIQAIGRASQIPVVDENDSEFMKAMGTADQTFVQIFKTMVYDPNKYNQYNLRDIMHPYIDVDYERSKYKDGEDATSLTLRQHGEALRVLADRAAILSPALLLPYHPIKNPKGVKYENITAPTLIIFSRWDNMMPELQRHRFRHVIINAPVQDVRIPKAGHFAVTDQPNAVAEAILKFIAQYTGIGSLADIFIGFDGIFKGDEREMIKDLRKIYSIDAKSKYDMYK